MAVGKGDQFAVGVSAYPQGFFSQRDQEIQRFHGLRSGGQVAGEDDAVSGDHVRLGEHRASAGSTP